MGTDEQAIRDVVEQWHRATAAGDIDSVLQLMTEDAVFLGAGRPPMRGRGSFEQGLRAALQSFRIDSKGDVREVEVSGELAYCWAYLTVRMIPLSGGEPKVRTGDTLSIFRKQPDGSWLLSRDANLLGGPS